MHRKSFILFAGMFWALLCLVGAQAPGPVVGVPQAQATSPSSETGAPVAEEETILPEPSVAEMRKLVGGMASEVFDIRERSQAALSKYAQQHPDAVRDGLAKDYVDSLDPEVRYRLAEVLYDAVVEDMEHSGFLGIIMIQSQAVVNGRVQGSVQVSKVLPNSAAARGGLRPGDQIVQVDDLTFKRPPPNQLPVQRVENSPNLLAFKDYIGGRKKGARVVLKIQRLVDRKSTTIEVPVRLGRRSRELMEDEELRAEDRFFEDWLQNRAAAPEKGKTP